MTRIVATSDLHGELPTIPECDLLLLAGDLCPEGTPLLQSQWLNTVFRDWLQKIPAKEIVGIAGNHDVVFEEENNSLIPRGLRWHYLKDHFLTVSGFKIYGTPWQLPFWGAFNGDEKKLANVYENIPMDIDILISHGPPYGILDEVPINQHTGSKALRNKVFSINPKLVVCGHIHGSFGNCQIDRMTFANVSLLNDEMEMANSPVIFDL